MSMNQKSIIGTLLIVGLTALVTAGCLSRGSVMPENPIAGYEKALNQFPGELASIDVGLERFSSSFADLTREDLGELMAELYAEELFFNDTIHTFTRRQDLVDYMVQTGGNLSESTVEIQQVIRDGADVFVRWAMDFKVQAAGRKVHSQSIGMTHLRFDGDGRVVLHQDFWDSGNALYAHLPVVGFMVRQAQRRM